MLKPSTAVSVIQSVMLPVPPTKVQVPCAGKMMELPCKVVLVVVPVGVHSSWSAPALASGLFWVVQGDRRWIAGDAVRARSVAHRHPHHGHTGRHAGDGGVRLFIGA